MAGEKIEVIAYAGHRAEESPRAFILQGKRVDVMKVLDQWIEENSVTREQKRFFKVKGSDFRNHTLCYDEAQLEWFNVT
ncbi:MAG: hypothetical protein FD174_3813 [Geobacteraceae bacterium]|nr:MAG: hypothetical protein FD174_3813 [Geobacteraceae bacterium]